MTAGLLYVGTHRRAHRADPVDIAFGVYAFRQAGDGSLASVGMTPAEQPGWIALHPGGGYLYVANEVGSSCGAAGGGVSAFALHPVTGALTALNSQHTSARPCHCVVDATGRYLLAATFGGGAVHMFPIQQDGSLGEQCDVQRHSGSSVHPRQQQPHAHAVCIDPANRFVLVPDLGTDQIWVYELDAANGRLIPRPQRAVNVEAGSGPRHLVIDQPARHAYLINEISATIQSFSYDVGTGGMKSIGTHDLLPPGFAGLRSGAAIALHPDGRHLYATTRSHGSSGEPPRRGLDSIVWFEIGGGNPDLRLRGRRPSEGEIPRAFALDPRGTRLYVGHQCSGTIASFDIDPDSGEPLPSGALVPTPVPVCLTFLPDSRQLADHRP
jgi:6-phosphogluconolactonase